MGVDKIREYLRRVGKLEWFYSTISVVTYTVTLNFQTELLAAEFSKLILENGKFEHFVPQHLGLTCFRLKNVRNFSQQQ